MYIKDGPLVKLLDGGMGQAMKKIYIYTQEKNSRRNKGNVKERKKEEKHAGWKFPTPAITFLMRQS